MYHHSDQGIRNRTADHYQLPVSYVDLEQRPHDCEFMTAPLGAKHCLYKPEYVINWVKMTDGSGNVLPKLVEYGTAQEEPPKGCFQDSPDVGRHCFDTELASPNIQVGKDWRARHVVIVWQKVED